MDKRTGQLEISFPALRRRGGSRSGAGRKPLLVGLRHTPHRARPVHRRAHPVHVTLRAFVRSLRCQQVVHAVLGAFSDSNRSAFRIVHYSVQANHVHLIVEADDKASLSSGVRGLMVRIAKRVNRVLFRRGRFWADRWHGHALRSPREVRNALVYVLQNHEKHLGKHRGSGLDPLSSAAHFDGFSEPPPPALRDTGPPLVIPARTWLLRVGWQRHGRITLADAPARCVQS